MLNGKTKPHRLALGMLAALAVAVATACGGSSGEKDAGDDGAKAPAAATTTPSQPAAAAAAPTTAAAAPSSLVLVASNILFDKKELSAAAGAVTLDLDNQDAGVPHNLHVFSGASATGDSLGATALEAGPTRQSLKLDLSKGQYFFVCDVHPTTMTGTITVG
ncbi:MAG: cupredoxin domain-containing protein [Chloroflexi bacterium]|nr:cupredoxin domain-containing protein [Chloroflexota bacterium]